MGSTLFGKLNRRHDDFINSETKSPKNLRQEEILAKSIIDKEYSNEDKSSNIVKSNDKKLLCCSCLFYNPNFLVVI